LGNFWRILFFLEYNQLFFGGKYSPNFQHHQQKEILDGGCNPSLGLDLFFFLLMNLFPFLPQNNDVERKPRIKKIKIKQRGDILLPYKDLGNLDTCINQIIINLEIFVSTK
jgi:hypothetical protein